ncbi:hypothetical protein ES703_103875 [subsurface metagenome]
MGVDLVYRTKLPEKFNCGDWTYVGNAGDIIRYVTYQSLKVGNLLRLDAVLLNYRSFVVEHGVAKGPPWSRVEHLYPGRN